ncbi:MAG: LamG domain-containing protein [Planctomycetota bacterium]|nr:LamG domain-containing protein [Planctomycetota bacterium]
MNMKTSRYICRVSGLAVALVAILTPYSQAVVIDYWRFEEPSGQALDSAGSNPGTLKGTASRSPNVFVNPVPATGAANAQTMYFDGTNDSAVDMGNGTLPPNSNPDLGIGDFTIEAWINRLGDNPDVYANIAGKFPSGDYGDTGIALYAGAVTFPEGAPVGRYDIALLARLDGGDFVTARTGTGSGSTNFFLDLGTWYHVAGVRKGNQFLTYVDGVLKGSLTVPAGTDYTEPLQTFAIGGALGGGTANWVGNFWGYIDEVRVSNTALDPVQFLNGALVAGVSGDYNNNGKVDAADYVLWRNGGPLQNEVDTPGTVNAADYAAWRALFGNPAGSGSGLVAGSAIPEPCSVMLALLGCLSWYCGRPPTRG